MGYSEICPNETDAEIESWCKKTFQKTGNVTLAKRTDPDKITCLCNNISSINVSIKASVPNDITLLGQAGNLNAKATCVWSGVFEDMPEGNYCTSMTGVNPHGCNEMDTSICFSNTCISKGDDYNMTCNTCDGRVFSIVKENKAIKRTYSPPINCNPSVNCSSHGCCNTQVDSTIQGPCKCYRDPEHGYWDGVACSDCLKGYKSINGNLCTTPSPSIQVILSSIATPMTMVLPNLTVLVIFAIIGLVRRLWDTDTPFRATTLRRANLSTVQSARRGEAGMFRPKQIPPRPGEIQDFMSDSLASGTNEGMSVW
ncbi:unnamed protein product [Phytomonas sp. Hart1]|nr:unnamed protein product [Phytomonas sp. Hart1]|eukprot:CCW68571.1 unnamed protein product [Phytomonas sp. isolate Hart1]